MTPWLAVHSTGIVLPRRDPSWAESLPPAAKRRDPRIWQLAHAASARALSGAPGLVPKSIVVGTALGALDETVNFFDSVFKAGFASPRNFIASVHNSMGGKLALDLKIAGPNVTVCDGPNSLASALVACDLLDDCNFPVLLVAVDERIALLDTLHAHLSGDCRSRLSAEWEEAAVAFLLSRDGAERGVRMRAFGPCPAGGVTPETAVRTLVETAAPGTHSYLPLDQCSRSFIQPAIAACGMALGEPSRAIIGSYSPASRGVAAVELINDKG